MISVRLGSDATVDVAQVPSFCRRTVISKNVRTHVVLDAVMSVILKFVSCPL